MRWIVLGFCFASAASGSVWAQPSPRSFRTEQAVSPDLIRLHDDLRLSESQEAAWRDYTRAIAPSRDAEARHRATTELLPLVPTPRRIALIDATMAQDEADFRRQGVAVNAFYDKLTPEQQRTFDRDSLPSEDDQKR